MRVFALIAAAVVLTLGAASCASGDEPKPATATALPYSVIGGGGAPDGTAAGTRVAEDRKQPEALGQDLGFSTTKQPPPDFATEMVVAVIADEKSTAGWKLEVVKVEKAGEGLVVVYREKPPAKDAVVAQALECPFVVLRVPRVPGKVFLRREPAK